MKIGEYKMMMSNLTRPGTPEQNKKADENNKKYLADRKAKTLKEYGLTDHVVSTLNNLKMVPILHNLKKLKLNQLMVDQIF